MGLLKTFLHRFGCFDHFAMPFDSELGRKQINRTTWTLFIVCFCFSLFVTARFITKVLLELQKFEGSQWMLLVTYIMYWFHYTINFFIYAARSGQYRKAYLFFFEEVRICLIIFL